MATPYKWLHTLSNLTLNICKIVRRVFGVWVQDGEPSMACWMSSMERICITCCKALCEGAHCPILCSRTGHFFVYKPSLDLLLSSWPVVIAQVQNTTYHPTASGWTFQATIQDLKHLTLVTLFDLSSSKTRSSFPGKSLIRTLAQQATHICVTYLVQYHTTPLSIPL